MRGLPSTFGSLVGSVPAIIFSDAADRANPSMSRTRLLRSRIEPSLANSPGFSAPATHSATVS